MAVERVIIKVDLCVQTQKLSILRFHQRIDLHQRAVLFQIQPDERVQKRLKLRTQHLRKANAVSSVHNLIGLEPHDGRNRNLDNCLRRSLRGLLNLRAACAGRHNHKSCPVHIAGNREIVFFFHCNSFCD